MATKRTSKPKPEPILNAEPLTSPGVIVTHPEKHITPGNASIVWLIVMMAIIGGVGAICTTIWWQKEDLAAQIEAPYFQDQSPFFTRFMRTMRARMSTLENQESRVAVDATRAAYYDIENWDAYFAVPLGAPTLSIQCLDEKGNPDTALNAALSSLTAGQMYTLTLPGGYQLVYTAHPASFPLEAIKNGNCYELGSSSIVHSYSDKILWATSNTCGGVAYTKDEDPDGSMNAKIADCERSQTIVTALFPKE